MVVTSLPAARDSGATQDRTASPSRCTVHAPHCAMPQPYFVPVRPRFSRRTQSRGVEGSTSRFTRCLFTVKETMGTPPWMKRGCECGRKIFYSTPFTCVCELLLGRGAQFRVGSGIESNIMECFFCDGITNGANLFR